MKINFNGQGMSIQFDKVPRLLYFNENGYGCGAIFLNGQRIKGLVEVQTKAHTTDDKDIYPLQYTIKRIDDNLHTIETIESGVNNE